MALLPTFPTSVHELALLQRRWKALLDPILKKTGYKPPTVQKFLSGSGTYVPTPGAIYIRVRMVGGGGGGGQSGASGGTPGGNGGSTTFGTSLLTANGGIGGTIQTPGLGGTAVVLGVAANIGGIATTAILSGNVKVGFLIAALTGAEGNGVGLTASATGVPGGSGGSSPLGGAGAGRQVTTGAGGAATANTGSGGGGASSAAIAAHFGGAGGGAGAWIEALIFSLSTFAFSVGAAGVAGIAGDAGGGLAGSGVIIIEEHYQ